MIEVITCKNCGEKTKRFKNPIPTVDAVIFKNNQILLIDRKNEPFGWALPGGFVDYGESTETAVIREVKEETNLDIVEYKLIGVFSDPKRDPRGHNISIAYKCTPKDISILKAGDDAGGFEWFDVSQLPENIAFDHSKIIKFSLII